MSKKQVFLSKFEQKANGASKTALTRALKNMARFYQKRSVVLTKTCLGFSQNLPTFFKQPAAIF